MIREIDVNDEFSEKLLGGVAPSCPSEPQAFYNKEGDCVEFLLSSESYYADRVDDLLTVYYGQASGEIVGSLIKGVKSFVRHFLQTAPGFAIEIEDDRVCLTHLFTAGLWRRLGSDEVLVKKYKLLRDTADAYQVSVEIPELV